MRIFLPTLICCCLFFTANAQVVNIPDANFKNALLTHSPVINTNGDGEIQISEALAYTGTIDVGYKNIADLTGINAFVNIRQLNCYSNRLTALNIDGLTALTTLYCSQNQLANFTLNNLPQLQQLQCGLNKFSSLTLANLPSLRHVNTQQSDSLATLTLSNLPSLGFVDCNSCKMSSLNMSGLSGLDTLYCWNNRLTVLTLSNPARLLHLSASNNLLTAMPSGLANINNLDVSNNKISVFDLNSFNALSSVRMAGNLCTSLTLSNKGGLISIDCQNNLISNLQLSNLFSLKSLYCFQNQISSLTLNGFPSLESVRCYNNQLSSLTLTNTPNMKDFMCQNNRLTSLSLSNMPLLQWIQCQNNMLTSISLNNLPVLYEIFCNNNQLTSLPFLDAAVLPKLRSINFSGNQVKRLTVENNPIMEQIIGANNPIDSFRLKNLPQLSWLSIEQTPLTSIKLDSLPKLRVLNCGKSDSLRSIALNLPALEQFNCDSSMLVSADLSQTKVIQCVVPHSPLLQYINLRNGALDPYLFYPYTFNDNPLLQFICVDDGEKTRIMDSVARQLPGQGVTVSTVCNFTPATSSTIKGTVRYNPNGASCSNADTTLMNVRLNNYDGTIVTAAFTNRQGQYVFHTLSNADTVMVALQQPSWFHVSPPMHTINIPTPGMTATADFCISPVGAHIDVAMSIVAISRARPGFDARYRIFYSNKGNILQSGSFAMMFNDTKLSFVSATIPPASQTGNMVSWNYVDLYPFETRYVEVTFHVAPPPVVNGGDLLNFVGNIEPLNGDEFPADNNATLVQTVTNSSDPNDKEVSEGSTIDISRAGSHLNYIIHFQNIGSADAIRVLIKDSLTNNLDWNSLIPIAASHPYTATMTKSNAIEFLFDNINLPPKSVNEAASQGFIAFKIKPKSGITVGETIDNQAKIYFDFNAPIFTNTVSTTITKPKLYEDPAGLVVTSNPAKDWLTFSVNPDRKIQAVSLYNSVGTMVYSESFQNTSTNQRINISRLNTGVYILVVHTYQWRSAQKVVIIK